MRAFLTYHLPVLAYGTLILAISSIPNLHTPGLKFLAADKIAHFLEYALFALLVYRSVRHLAARHHSTVSLLVAILFLAAFAAGDEYVQKFTPGRHSDTRDFLLDLLGGTLVVLILWARHHRQAVANTRPVRFFNKDKQP
jgi:VanZ family protein